VVDVSEPIEEIREKLVTCHDTLYERNEAPIVTVLNKTDAVSEEELAEKREALSALAPNPVAVSGKEGLNVEALDSRISRELPPLQEERLVLPMTDETMSLVSWLHDNTRVDDVTYEDEHVLVEFAARPAIVERSRAKASELSVPESA
jgi:GTP-binding protein HflX